MPPPTTPHFDPLGTSRSAVARWGGDPDSVEIVQITQNIVSRFREQSGGVTRYLRLTLDAHRSRGMLEAELEFIAYLKSQHCLVAAAIPSAAGHLVETLFTPAGELRGVVFEAATGAPARWGDDAENRAILRERGRALGRIHRAAKSFHPQLPPRFHWHEDELFLRPELFLPDSQPQLRAEYEQVMQWVRRRPVTAENYGMIHGDFGSSNCLRHDGQVIAFDFDDCCYHWFAFDIAIAIWAARNLPDKYRRPYLQCFLESYSGENTLAGDTCDEIGWFVRLAAIYRYTYALRTQQSEEGELEEFRRLIEKPIVWC